MEFKKERRAMVQDQLIARGIRDSRVLEAMAEVPRERFVPPERAAEAYADRPLPIGQGQTISQPYIVALMLELLGVRPSSKVLEIGTGTGYQAALLAALGAKVCSVERLPELARAAEERLRALGFSGVVIRVADGSLGWSEEAPFDGIVVSASAPRVPRELTDQLADGGTLLIPVGETFSQVLTVVQRRGGGIEARAACGCAFVPLVGARGWPEGEIQPEEWRGE